jgi:hypothetical protein
MAKKAKLPADANKRAKSIVDLATGEGDPSKDVDTSGKNPAAVALGKLGGKNGGPARAKSLSEERRSEIAKKAAKARWKK